MTPFYFVVASLPFALYLTALAHLHGRRRPTLVTGRRDGLALALATVGVLFIGPLQILPSMNAWIAWGAGAWVLVAFFFVLVATTVISRLRPRFVVYNTTLETLRKTISRVAIELDVDARWSGDAMNMPGLGVQFYLDDSPMGRATSVVSIGRDISASGWKRLQDALDAGLADAPAPPRRLWLLFITVGLALLAADAWCFARYYEQIVESASFYISV